MGLSTRKLNYQDANNKTVIKLYTSLNDIYTGKGMPITYKGETAYAPMVPVNDVYGTPIRVSDASGEYRIAYDTVGTVQQCDISESYYKYLSGSTQPTYTYGSTTFVVPYATTIHLLGKLDAMFGHYGVSGNKWQWDYIDTYVDDKRVARLDFRQSMGEYRQWFTIADLDIDVTAGTHILTLKLTHKCSSKDSHEAYVYQWKNTITLK